MPTIRILPDDREIQAETGETILQAAIRAGLALTHACGGNSRCSTCRVHILEGLEHCSPPGPQEKAVAEVLSFGPSIRLACQTAVHGPLTLRRLVLDDEDVELTSLFIKGVDPGGAGVEKRIFILFADIAGFTAFSEGLFPYDVIHVLNRCFHRLGEIITRHGGVINTYMGDGLMALFEADDPAEGALRAVRAGLEMIAATQNLEPYLLGLFHKTFQLRVGLHYGQVVAGTVGALGAKKQTVIGDAVNFASRVEAANKKAGTRFLISAEVYDLVKAKVAVGQAIHPHLPGKSGTYTLFEITGVTPS